MAHFFKIKISVVAAGDNFPDACTEESADPQRVRNEALLSPDVPNLGASRTGAIEDDLEGGLSTRRPAVGTPFFASPGCPRSAAIRARCWVRRVVPAGTTGSTASCLQSSRFLSPALKSHHPPELQTGIWPKSCTST